jgi:hypothetical protein
MLLKGFSVRFIIIFLLTVGLWFVCGLMAVGYEDGTDGSSFGWLCYSICDALTFSRGLFDGIDSSILGMGLPLLITALILAIVVQGLAVLWIQLRKQKRR